MMGPTSVQPRRRQELRAHQALAALIALLAIASGALAAPAPPPQPKGPAAAAAAARPAAAAAAPRPAAAPPPPPSSSSALPPGEYPPLYGNYCGLQNSTCTDVSFRKAPVDDLDAACQRHDKCWCRSGQMDCACDKALLESARQLLQRSRASLPAQTAAMATAVAAYFSVAPCVCRDRKFCLPTCGARGCTWGGPNCRQAVSPGLGGRCAVSSK
jgi:hypothetical protein